MPSSQDETPCLRILHSVPALPHCNNCHAAYACWCGRSGSPGSVPCSHSNNRRDFCARQSGKAVVLLMTPSILMWKQVQRCDRQAQAFLHIHHNLFISLPCLLSPSDWTEQLQRDRRDRQNAASPAAYLSIHSRHHLPTPLFPGAACERTTHYLWIHRPTYV